MTFQKLPHDVKTNVEATFLKRFCAGWDKDQNKNQLNSTNTVNLLGEY